MSNKRRSFYFVIIITSMLLLAACNSGPIQVTRLVEVDREITLPPGEPEVNLVEVTRIVEREVDRIVEVTPTPTPIPSGGFLVTALSADLAQFNPVLVSDEQSRFVSSFLYGSMLRPDPMTGEMICHFCSSWTLNGNTFHFNLRDDIAWSDGEAVTADDFIYTYAALLWGLSNESLETDNLGAVEGIESINKLDDYAVAVTMKDNNCAGIHDLDLGWLPQHLYGPNWHLDPGQEVTLAGPFGSADDPNFAGLETNEMNHAPIVSSGPFLFQDWAPGDQVTLVRNAGYFKGIPHLDGLVFWIMPDEGQRLQMLRWGEIHLLEDISPKDLTQVELTDELSVHKVLGDSYMYLGLQLGDPAIAQARWLEDENTGAPILNELHGEHPILGDKWVRQAIAYGIDRNTIINRVAIGQGVPMAANVLPALQWAFDGDLEPRQYDPGKAAAVLDDAGWLLNEDSGVREKDGRRLQLDMITNLSSDTRVQIGELVKEQLESLGFEITFEALEWGAFVGLLLEQQFDMVVISWSNLANKPDDALFFSSENDVPGRGFNFVSYYNPTMDELWRNAATLPGCNSADRSVLYRRIQATLHDELPYIWLYTPLKLIGMNEQLVGPEPGPWDTWYNVETWYLVNR